MLAYKHTHTKDGRLRKKYRDRFAKMADWIVKSERTKKRGGKAFFSYRKWFHAKGHTVAEAIKHPCGTVGCIGGWAEVFHASEIGESDMQVCDLSNADGYTYLGLEHWEGGHLFYGYFHPKELDAPVKDVIAELRRIAKTGIVMVDRAGGM